jgi:hypothetical protein
MARGAARARARVAAGRPLQLPAPEGSREPRQRIRPAAPVLHTCIHTYTLVGRTGILPDQAVTCVSVCVWVRVPVFTRTQFCQSITGSMWTRLGVASTTPRKSTIPPFASLLSLLAFSPALLLFFLNYPFPLSLLSPRRSPLAHSPGPLPFSQRYFHFFPCRSLATKVNDCKYRGVLDKYVAHISTPDPHATLPCIEFALPVSPRQAPHPL